MSRLASLPSITVSRRSRPGPNHNAYHADNNKLAEEDRPAHGWYRFVLSFPPHLVRQYLDEFGLSKKATVLDPFCGTGTTVVEARKQGIPSIGIEANPMAFFASTVKVDYSPSPDGLWRHAKALADSALAELDKANTDDDEPFFKLRKSSANGPLRGLPAESAKLLLSNSISPLPLHRTLVLLDHITRKNGSKYAGHEKLALANAVVNRISNLHFGPEVGVGPPKDDAPVVSSWLSAVKTMCDDLKRLRELRPAPVELHLADARELLTVVKPNSVDAVITSPPYPNEKDYTRTTRLESVLLGFLRNKSDLRRLKQGLIRSNTRNVYKRDTDDQLVAGHKEIQRIASAIEARRIELGKTSGFERLYARVTRLYFGGMLRHLSDLRQVLRPGARLAYVVGDQASYLQVMIRTGQLLADIAQSLGYQLVRIDLFRTRRATATRRLLREEAVILRWPG